VVEVVKIMTVHQELLFRVLLVEMVLMEQDNKVAAVVAALVLLVQMELLQ